MGNRFLPEYLHNTFPGIFPFVWQPSPENPIYRGGGYDRYRLTNLEPNQIRDIFWKICPQFSKVPVDEKYWREIYPPLNAHLHEFWVNETGIKDKEKLKQHFNSIREAAWQIVQEFTIARWWFLRSIMAESPYYHELRELARKGATVIDLGCGLGQELRWLKADGATGELIGVDSRLELWNLGSKLFQAPEDEMHFRTLDIITGDDNSNPLAEFSEKADIYLLNDVMSFYGSRHIQGMMLSIQNASKVGTKVFGWLFGQDGEPDPRGPKEFGGGYRGAIPTLKTFTTWFMNITPNEGEVKWDLQVQLVGFDKLGFDEEDQNWLKSDFWNVPDPLDCPNELKAICFLATRTQ
jgi:hypothetical protein